MMLDPERNLILAQHLAREIGNHADSTIDDARGWIKKAAHLIEELLADDVEDVVRASALAHLNEIPAAQRTGAARTPTSSEGHGIASFP